MAYRTKTGAVIGGKLGEALAKADPSRGMSIAPTVPVPPKKRSGGGGGGSNEVGFTPAQSILPPKEPTLPTTPAPSKFVPTKSTTSTNNLTPQQQSFVAQQNQQQTNQNIYVQRSGGVRVGSSTYYGNAIVQGTGKTANQFQQELRAEASKKYGKPVGTGRVSGIYTNPNVETVTTTEIPARTITSSSTPISNTFFSGIVSDYNNINSNIRTKITEPTIGKFFESQNFNPEEKDFSTTTNFLRQQRITLGKIGDVMPFLPYALETAAGAGVGILQEVRTKPLKTIVVAGIGAGIGAGSEAVVAGASYISPTIGAITGGAFKIGGLALTGIYGANVVKEVVTSKSYSQAGSVVGTNLLYGSAGGLGFATGQKGFNVVKGYWNVRGREYIDIPQGEYPTLPQTQTQVKIFQKNIYSEFGKEAGAFHTTSSNFWKSGTITPESGSSELSGLYGSYKISTPFSKINKNSYSGFNVPTSIKEVFTGSTNPAVAYLKPEGFRYSPAVKVSKTGTLNWLFKNPAKEGYADIPLIKSEAEAIFRPEAGAYNIQTEFSKFYTKIFGVPVKIDVFKYGGESVVALPTSSLSLVGGASSYNLPVSSYPIFTPSSIGASYLSNKGSSPTSKESYVSVAPSSVSYSISSSSNAPSSVSSISNIYSSKGSSRSRSSNISPSTISSVSKSISSAVSQSSLKSISKGSSSYYPKPSKSYYPVTSSRKETKSPAPIKINQVTTQKEFQGLFPVSVRRKGQFRIVGYGKSPMEAIGIGNKVVRNTLARTFKVGGFKGSKVKGYRTKMSKKEGQVFIQPAKSSLSALGEKQEIKMFKQMKGGLRRK
jgi:hypothetical protein